MGSGYRAQLANAMIRGCCRGQCFTGANVSWGCGLQSVIEKLGKYRSRRRWWRRWVKRSAVAIVLRERDGQTQVLMIKRAERVGDPWSGHMAFPGGRMDPGDRTGLRTAMRETHEEIGIQLEKAGSCIGRLSDIVSRPHSGRRPMVVTPYVFHLHTPVGIETNHEVAEALWVPMTYLQALENRQTMQFRRAGVSMDLPCYDFQGKRIWGMSLRMLDELMALIQA